MNIVGLLMRVFGLFADLRKTPIPMPGKFQVFNKEIPEKVAKDTAEAYVTLFGKDPWNEEWKADYVVEKMKRDIYPFKFLFTIMKGNDEFPIGGFSWGVIIPASEIRSRIESCHTKAATGVSQVQMKEERILFVDELGILEEFRGGAEPLQFLFRGLLELAMEEEVGIICWTVFSSKIYSILVRFGFQEITVIEDVVFLYGDPNLVKSLGKIALNLNFRQLQRIITWTSRLK